MPRSEAARGYPVHLRGVITCIWPDDPRNYVMQDATHGVFLQQSNLFLADRPQFGEFWDVQGVTGGGYFSPLIEARSMQRISDGRLPEPQRAEWDQLGNGSLDNQYVEIEGVILRVETNTLTLLGGVIMGGTIAPASGGGIIVQSGAFSVVGGGETVEFIEKKSMIDKFSHVSTGGGAMLNYLSGESLPGIEALG